MLEKLLELAEKYLNDRGQIDVEELIEKGEIENAKGYIFGAIEKAWNDEEISDFEYTSDVESLQIPEELKDTINSFRAHRITRTN